MRGGGAGRLHHRIRAAEGMVTAEFAVAILAVLPLMLAVVFVTAAAAVQVQVMEAARTGARMLARGDGSALVEEHVMSVLPSAEVDVAEAGPNVVVTVQQEVDVGGLVPPFTVQGRAMTPKERP